MCRHRHRPKREEKDGRGCNGSTEEESQRRSADCPEHPGPGTREKSRDSDRQVVNPEGRAAQMLGGGIGHGGRQQPLCHSALTNILVLVYLIMVRIPPSQSREKPLHWVALAK